MMSVIILCESNIITNKWLQIVKKKKLRNFFKESLKIEVLIKIISICWCDKLLVISKKKKNDVSG